MKIIQGDSPSTGMVIGAAAILIGTVGYLVLVPAEQIGNLYGQQKTKLADLSKQISMKNEQYATLSTAPASHLYTTTAEQAAPESLTRLNAIARASHVVINGFRPQKEQDNGDVQILPYFMTVEGAFDGISSFLTKLDSTDPKLTISLIQIAAPETGTAQTTASINVVGYLKPAVAPDGATDASSGQSTSANSKPAGAKGNLSQLGAPSATPGKGPAVVTATMQKSSQSLTPNAVAENRNVQQVGVKQGG